MPLAYRIVAPAVLGLVIVAGCRSDAGPAVNHHGTPVADTGFIAPGTTGGDAAGTFNLRSDEGRGEGHGNEPPASGHGGARTPPAHGGAVDTTPNPEHTAAGGPTGTAAKPSEGGNPNGSRIPTRPTPDPVESTPPRPGSVPAEHSEIGGH